MADYDKSLIKAYKSGVHEGLASGLWIGSVMFIVLCSYALVTWFGSKMVLEKRYAGGDVIIVIIAMVTGST